MAGRTLAGIANRVGTKRDRPVGVICHDEPGRGVTSIHHRETRDDLLRMAGAAAGLAWRLGVPTGACRSGHAEGPDPPEAGRYAVPPGTRAAQRFGDGVHLV